MSNTSCTEFNRLLEESIEARLPLDTPEFRGHADQCADCRLAWLDALLLDGAVSQWRKSANARLPVVDLTDVVLYRKAAAQAETLSVGSEQRANSLAANEPIASTPGTRPLDGTRVPAAVAETRQSRRSLGRRIAALAAVGIAAAVCVAALAGRASRQHEASLLVNRTSPSPLPKTSRGDNDLPDCIDRSTSAGFAYEVTCQTHCRGAARNARRRLGAGRFRSDDRKRAAVHCRERLGAASGTGATHGSARRGRRSLGR